MTKFVRNDVVGRRTTAVISDCVEVQPFIRTMPISVAWRRSSSPWSCRFDTDRHAPAHDQAPQCVATKVRSPPRSRTRRRLSQLQWPGSAPVSPKNPDRVPYRCRNSSAVGCPQEQQAFIRQRLLRCGVRCGTIHDEVGVANCAHYVDIADSCPIGGDVSDPLARWRPRRGTSVNEISRHACPGLHDSDGGLSGYVARHSDEVPVR